MISPGIKLHPSRIENIYCTSVKRGMYFFGARDCFVLTMYDLKALHKPRRVLEVLNQQNIELLLELN